MPGTKPRHIRARQGMEHYVYEPPKMPGWKAVFDDVFRARDEYKASTGRWPDTISVPAVWRPTVEGMLRTQNKLFVRVGLPLLPDITEGMLFFEMRLQIDDSISACVASETHGLRLTLADDPGYGAGV